MKKKINVLVRVIVMIMVFVITIYFVNIFENRNYKNLAKEMNDAELPLAYVSYGDTLLNCMHGYTSDVDITLLRDSITPIDEQTHIISNIKEAKKNATVLGARVLKRKDAPPVYNANAGLRQSSYPLTWTDDIAICNLAEKLASSDEERPFDSHSHPDIEEYKFILSGSGSVTIGVGDETCEEEYYEFKAGDLVILPRGLAHVDAGGYSALYFHAKQSVFGKTPGDSLYPHIAYVYTRPHRPTKEEEEALNDPGTFIKMNSRETYNVYCPNPIERIEKNPTDMTHLRPDLFPETEA